MRDLQFHRSLYQQHVEDISMLYTRRVGLLDDPAAGPEDLGNLELRLDAHLDGLVVGGETALAVCREQALVDPGTLFGAVGAFARQHRADLLQAVAIELAALAEDPDELSSFAVALTDALRFEAPGNWAPLVATLLMDPAPIVVTAIARFIGYRRWPMGPQLLAALGTATTRPAILALVWAVGRVREPTAKPMLYHYARNTDAEVAIAACLALMRLRDTSVLDYLVQLTPTHPSAASLLAISGDPRLAAVVHARLTRPEVTNVELLAASLCGDPAIVPSLLHLLEHGRDPAAVAEALYLVTGAPVFETIETSVEPIEPGLADPRDVVTIERLAQAPLAWRAWWDAHGGRLTAGVKHRLGRPNSPAIAGELLHQFVIRRSVRELVADELDLAYGPQWAVDVDIPLAWQRAGLAQLQDLQATRP